MKRIDKLGKSDGIEKTGVSVMFEATKNGIFSAYLCEESGGYIPPWDLVIWEGQLYRKPMGEPFHTDMFPLWKYGEDWALTKEELRGENDVDQRD